MRISHETPLCLLNDSRQFNDYDYALVHLFEENSEYFRFYVESLQMGREVILDNSAYELGKSFDLDKFFYWIKKLKPTYYIIPDDKMDLVNDRALVDLWFKRYAPQITDSKSIGVVHGNDSVQFLANYQYLLSKVDKISISTEDFFADHWTGQDLGAQGNLSYGRVNFLKKLYFDNHIDRSKPHHILGCICPQEFIELSKIPCFETADTSNPVLHGLLGIKYEDWGLSAKSSIKLADLLKADVDYEQLRCIMHNLFIFKKFLK